MCSLQPVSTDIFSNQMEKKQPDSGGEDLPHPLGNWSENEIENEGGLKTGAENRDEMQGEGKGDLDAANAGNRERDIWF